MVHRMSQPVDKPVKKMGRPRTGRAPAISARLPADVADAVEDYARRHQLTRSNAIVALLRKALPPDMLKPED